MRWGRYFFSCHRLRLRKSFFLVYTTIGNLTIKGVRKNFNNNKRLFCTFIDIIREKNRIIPWFCFETKINLQFYTIKFQVYFCFKAKPRDYPVFLAYYVNKSAKKTFIPIINVIYLTIGLFMFQSQTSWLSCFSRVLCQ